MRHERLADLKLYIQDKQFEPAIGLVRTARDHREAEDFVFTVLNVGNSPPELVEAILQAFLETRVNRYRLHGHWVHSLYHFTPILWERRLDEWLKKFYEASFQGANELGDPICSGYLLHQFADHANYADDPADFHITPENIKWMEWQHYPDYVQPRIDAAPFASKAAYLAWKLRRPENHTHFDRERNADLVNAEWIRDIIQEIKDLGEDVSEFDGFEQELLAKHLAVLKKRLASTMSDDWYYERLEYSIELTEALLDNPTPT